MRTTVDLNDSLLQSAKEYAVRSHRTLRSLIEEGLSRLLEEEFRPSGNLEPLPTWHGVPFDGIDFTNNAQLLDIMDGYETPDPRMPPSEK
jgi:hypothetical protein